MKKSSLYLRLLSAGLLNIATFGSFMPRTSKADTYYVATNGTHILPYDTWEKAATNIQAAINTTNPDINYTNNNILVKSGQRFNERLNVTNNVNISASDTTNYFTVHYNTNNGIVNINNQDNTNNQTNVKIEGMKIIGGNYNYVPPWEWFSPTAFRGLIASNAMINLKDCKFENISYEMINLGNCNGNLENIIITNGGACDIGMRINECGTSSNAISLKNLEQSTPLIDHLIDVNNYKGDYSQTRPSYLSIENVTARGSSLNKGEIFRFGGLVTATIEDCNAYRAEGGQAMQGPNHSVMGIFGPTNKITARNITANNFPRGFTVYGDNGGTELYIDGCTIKDYDDQGIYAGGMNLNNNNKLTIENTTFSNTNSSIPSIYLDISSGHVLAYKNNNFNNNTNITDKKVNPTLGLVITNMPEIKDFTISTNGTTYLAWTGYGIGEKYSIKSSNNLTNSPWTTVADNITTTGYTYASSTNAARFYKAVADIPN